VVSILSYVGRQAVAPSALPVACEHRFYRGMALAIALVWFAGVGPSHHLHLHGLAFTAWIALLVAQTSLIAAGRTRLHRTLGITGAVLAVLMIVLVAALPAIPFATLIVFPALIGAALYFRKRDVHKRLMLLGTIEIVTAAVARLPGIAGNSVATFGVTDLFVVALVVHDLVTRGRVHRATFWGGLLLIASQALRLMISGVSG
jgi:hypothetical protein